MSKKFFSFSSSSVAKQDITPIDVDSKDRYNSISNFQASKKFSWDAEIIESLNKLAIKYKMDWKKIARRMKTLHKANLSPTSLKSKYKSIINPARQKDNKNNFTPEEDRLLFKLQSEHRFDWNAISEKMPNRKSQSLKNRYYYLRKRNITLEVISRPESEKSEQLLEKNPTLMMGEYKLTTLVRDLDISWMVDAKKAEQVGEYELTTLVKDIQVDSNWLSSFINPESMIDC